MGALISKLLLATYSPYNFLSYTFFESKSDLTLPSPFDPSNRPMMVNNDNNQQQKSPQQQQQQLVSSA
uniref:Ovule protein n=1 Tax=Globodera pallida TaxID=36090 RepID=A0A183BQB7_GLOPA